MAIDRSKILRAALFTAYFFAAFLAFVVILFPYDRIKDRLETEVRTGTPYELTIARISPLFLNRFRLVDVVVSDRDGTVLFETPAVRTHISLFNFLRGLVAVGFKGRAYGGEFSVRTELGKKRRFYSLDAQELDIGMYSMLTQKGLKLSGRLGGTAEMTDGNGKARIWVRDLAGRELSIVGFAVPDLDFQQGWIEVETKGDRLTVRKLELDGKDLKVRASGDLVMQPRGLLNLVIRFKPSETLRQQQEGLLSLLKTRDAEGFYQVVLGGTLAAPVPRF